MNVIYLSGDTNDVDLFGENVVEGSEILVHATS
jgi:hypothetical protein